MLFQEAISTFEPFNDSQTTETQIKAMQTLQPRLDILRMQERLKMALTDPTVSRLVHEDLVHTFGRVGIIPMMAMAMVDRIVSDLIDTKDLEVTEHDINVGLRDIIIDNKSLIEILDDKMKDRAKIIFRQVFPFIANGTDFFEKNIIDYGCGDGRVTDLVYNNVSVHTVGYDVRDYPAQGISAPVRKFDGAHVPIGDGYYDIGLMTNVAHHEADNAKILRELSRIIRKGGRLVVIETVPVKDEPAEFERTFVGDYVYNRLFHSADVPVPGTYETESGWVRRFAKVGFELEEWSGITNPTPLGYDQPTIRDWHTRLVLRKA